MGINLQTPSQKTHLPASPLHTPRLSRTHLSHTNKMQSAFLLPLLLLAAAALARPSEPPADRAPQPLQALEEPRSPQLPQDAQPDVDGALVRERRSPKDKERGTITGSVHREKGVGTVVRAQGQGNVWTSKRGNTRVDAHGEWSKVVRGPARGKPNYSAGIRFSHRF